MDKIKNIINPGSKHDDEVMYGSGQSNDPIHGGTTGSTTGQGSHLGGSRSGTSATDPLSSTTNPSSGTTSGLGSNTTGTTTSGMNDPSFASRMPTNSDAASTTSIKSGVEGFRPGSTLTASSGPNDPLDTNKPLPREPAMAGSGHTGPSGSGLTGSSLPDRSVGSSGLGNTSSTTGESHLGRDAALGAGAVGAAGAAHHHHDRERDTLGSDTGRSFPLGGNSTSTTGSGYPSNTAGSTTAGPHSSNLVNKADPRVDSDLSGSRNTGATGLGSGTGASAGPAHQGHLGRDAAIGGGTVGASGLAEHERGGNHGATGSAIPTGVGYGPESWEHDHSRHGHQYEGDPCGPEAHVPGPHFSKGPHATDTANLLDPHVASPIVPLSSASGIGATGTTTGTGVGSSTGTGLGSTGTGSSHLGRDTTLAGGVGAAGAGAYEASRDTSNPTSTSAGSAPSTAGPHKSDMLNKLDPRVDSDRSKQQGTSGTPGMSGTGGTSSTGASGYPSTSSTTGRDHHLGRDAGLLGAGGAAMYETDKHHHPRGSGLTGTSGTGSSGIGGTGPEYGTDSAMRGTGTAETSGRDHHLGRDAGLVGAGGAAAHEAEKHHGHHQPSGTTASGYENPYPSSTVDPRVDSTSHTGTTGTGHHHGRDAGLVGTGGVAAYEAEKHHDKHDKHNPLTTTDASTHGDHHKGRDAAVAGGVGAAGGAEFSKKEAEKIQKEQEKEHKKHVKEEEKHQKEHDKHEKHDKHDEKKHGGLLGKLFHHDKVDKDVRKEENLEREGLSDSKHHGHHHGAETAAGAGAVGAAGVGLTEAEKHQQAREHDRNRLHKDPPTGMAPKTEYAEAPTGGYASQVTGGTGTTALAQGESVDRGSHLSGFGNKLDPNVAERGENVSTGAEGRAIEPHSGLPIDLSKGKGEGGTDGGVVPGYHSHNGGGGSSTGTGL